MTIFQKKPGILDLLIAMLILAVLIFVWSKDSDLNSKDRLLSYHLEKIKEFKINSLLPVELIDYYPPEGLYLGYTITSNGLEITLINEIGEILTQKNMRGEGPNEYSTRLTSLSFSDDGEIWALTTNQVLLYDQNLNLKKRISYDPINSIVLYNRAEVFSYFFKNEDKSDISFITSPSGTVRYREKNLDFREGNMIEIYRLNENNTYEIAPIYERSLFKSLDKSIGGLYYPIYALDRENFKLYLTASLDNEITVYDLNTGKLTARIEIDHEDFINLNTTITAERLPSYNGMSIGSQNFKIFKMERELLVLEYIKKIPFDVYKQKKSYDPNYHHFNDHEYHKLILFDKNNQLTNDLSIPPNATLKMSLPNNMFLVKLEHPNIEEDFTKYGVFRLSKKSH